MLVPARAIFLVCAPSKIDEQSGAQIVFDFKTKATHERCLSPLFNLRLCAGGLKEREQKTHVELTQPFNAQLISAARLIVPLILVSNLFQETEAEIFIPRIETLRVNTSSC